jgi:hypothetical protein
MNILCPFKLGNKNIVKAKEKRATIRRGAKVTPAIFFNLSGGSVVCGFGKIIRGRLKERSNNGL